MTFVQKKRAKNVDEIDTFVCAQKKQKMTCVLLRKKGTVVASLKKLVQEQNR